MFIHRKTTAVLAVIALGVATSPVRADTASTEAILRECAHAGLISGAHTPAELREAAANMPADAAEYTACPDEIDRELARALADAKPAAAGSASTLTRGLTTPAAGVSPDELVAAMERAEAEGATEPTQDPSTLAEAETAAGAASGADEGEPTSRNQAKAGDPAAKSVGNAVAAATVGASLLALARPAMLRRRRLDDA